MVKVKVITTRPMTTITLGIGLYLFYFYRPPVYDQFICGGDLPNARQFSAQRNTARVSSGQTLDFKTA